MKRYKVIAGVCFTEKKQIVYAAGSELTEDDFLDGEADRLVGGGFIEEIEQPKEEKKANKK